MLFNKSFKMDNKFVTHSDHTAPPESNFVQIVFFLRAKDNHSIDNKQL